MADVTDIVLSPAWIYYAPVGEAEPDETDIAYGEAWGGDWVNLGYTLTPLAIAVEDSTFELEVEQVPLPVKEIRTKQVVTFETTLAEMTAEHMKLAMGSSSTISTTAAGASQVGFEEISVGGETALPLYAWGIEGYTQDDDNNILPVRMFIFKGQAKLNGNIEFSKQAAAGLPLQIKALADTSRAVGVQLFKFQRVTGPVTA